MHGGAGTFFHVQVKVDVGVDPIDFRDDAIQLNPVTALELTIDRMMGHRVGGIKARTCRGNSGAGQTSVRLHWQGSFL